MRQSSATVVAIFGLLMSGCDGGDRHMQRKVTAAEIVGTWKMTTASRQLLKRDGYVESPGQAYTITFNNDGSLSFASVLDELKGGTDTNCTGSWQLQHDKPVDNKIVRANLIELELPAQGDTHFRKLSLTEESGKLRLWDFYGDPDSREFIEYERP